MFARILLEVDLMSWKVCAFLSLPEIKRFFFRGVVAIYMSNTAYKNMTLHLFANAWDYQVLIEFFFPLFSPS